MSRLNRTTAAVFLAGVWLTSPVAVGVAAADRLGNGSSSDSADSDGAGGAAPRAAQHDAGPEKNFAEIDQLPAVVEIDDPWPGKPAVAIDDALPEAQSGEASEEAQSGEASEEALPGEAVEEALDGEAVEEALPGEAVEEALPGEAVEEALPGEAVEEALPGEAVEDAAPESGAESTDPATEDAGGQGAPEPDPKAETPTEDQQSVDVVGGRGGGVTPLPFWRGSVGDPQQLEGDAEPVALESTSVDPGGLLPDPSSPGVDTDPPVYYFDGTTGPADPPVLTTGVTGQPPGGETPQFDLGSDTLTEAVANGINQVLDAVGGWISGLPAGPLQDLLAGVLLLVRNALPQEWAKQSRLGSGQLVDGDDGGGESDADSGEPDSDGEDSDDSDDTGSDDADSDDADSDVSDSDGLLEGLTGLGEGDAEAAAGEQGLTVRVVARDGEYFAVTKDYRTDRVNFVIDNGVVVKASIG